MRTIVISALLLSAALAGCLQDGETVDRVEPASTSNATDQTNASETGHNATRGSSNASSSAENQTDTDPQGSSEDAGSESGGNSSDDDRRQPAQPEPAPFNLSRSIELGYTAAVGVEWTSPSEEQENGPQNTSVEDPGQTDATHCPTADVTIPEGTQRFEVRIDGEPANGTPSVPPSVPPSTNQTPPSVGTYSFVLHPPEGDAVQLSWSASQQPDTDELNWSSDQPTTGTWTIEAEPEGPVVDQTWRVDLTVAGERVHPPLGLAAATTC